MIMMVVGMMIVVIVKILGQGFTLNLRLKRYHCPKIQTTIQLENWGHFDDNVRNDSTFFQIDISANHWGHFELKLCPTNGKTHLATQECELKNSFMVIICAIIMM